MGETTAIEWCDHTFNPWIGCTKVSPGCDNCYAEALMDHRYGRVEWGPHGERSRTGESNWRQPLAWNRKAEREGRRPFVFCASLADVFDNQVDPQWRADLFDLIRRTPQLVWLLLTKRPQNIVKQSVAAGGLPPNVAIGASAPTNHDLDIALARLPAVEGALFRFLSCEPMLEMPFLDAYAKRQGWAAPKGPAKSRLTGVVDWVIVGGESGANARPMDLRWAQYVRDHCQEHGVVFNFKQVGGRRADKGGHELDGKTYFNRPAVPPLVLAA